MEQIEKYKLLVACYEQELERICQENNLALALFVDWFNISANRRLTDIRTEPSHDFQREVEQIKKEINEL